LTVRDVKGTNPIRVVLDSKARIPSDSKLLNGEAPTIVAVTRDAPIHRVMMLRRKTKVLVQKRHGRVDPTELLRDLKTLGVRKVLVEGGGEVRWSFFEANLVDDFFVWVAPYVWGGRDAPTLVDGSGFIHEAVPLRLVRSRVVDHLLILSFSVKRSQD